VKIRRRFSRNICFYCFHLTFLGSTPAATESVTTNRPDNSQCLTQYLCRYRHTVDVMTACAWRTKTYFHNNCLIFITRCLCINFDLMRSADARGLDHGHRTQGNNILFFQYFWNDRIHLNIFGVPVYKRRDSFSVLQNWFLISWN